MTPPPAVSDAEVEALIRYADSKAETAAAGEAGMWRSMAATVRSLHRDRQTAEARSAAGVPDGWRLVPAELADAMNEAYVDAYANAEAASAWETRKVAYRAMLSAAPTPPAGGADNAA